MIRPKQLIPALCVLPLFAPISASALVVDVQGNRLEIASFGASCVELTGLYPGVRIEASEKGKTPRICYNSNKVNSIAILDTRFVAVGPTKKTILVKFEHEFPAGINGKIMVRSKLQGFFSAANGVGVPAGDKLKYSAYFTQTGRGDALAEPFDKEVGEEIESALFEFSTKKPYLVSGPRTLKGTLVFSFAHAGDSLSLVEKSGLFLDTGSTMEDKLESIEIPPIEEDEENKPPVNPETKPEATKPSMPSSLPFH